MVIQLIIKGLNYNNIIEISLVIKLGILKIKWLSIKNSTKKGYSNRY